MDATASFLNRTFTRKHTVFGVSFGTLSPNLLSPSGKYNPDDVRTQNVLLLVYEKARAVKNEEGGL